MLKKITKEDSRIIDTLVKPAHKEFNMQKFLLAFKNVSLAGVLGFALLASAYPVLDWANILPTNSIADIAKPPELRQVISQYQRYCYPNALQFFGNGFDKKTCAYWLKEQSEISIIYQGL